MACENSFASPQQFFDFFQMSCSSADEESQAQIYLDLVASDIHAALAATGACDCTFASWANGYLAKINIIEAAVLFQQPCGPELSEDMKKAYLEWITKELDKIRTGKLELCAGETGSEYPAIAWAEMGLTEFNQARIISNDIDRNSA